MLRQILIPKLIYEQDWIIYEQDWTIYEQDWTIVFHKISDMAIHFLYLIK